jgi:hypothetical protein
VRFVERSSRRLARATFFGMARWQGRLEHRQGFLGRLVDAGAELFAMVAVCVRAHAQVSGTLAVAPEVDDGAAASAVDLADAFCRQARRRVERHLHDLWHNTDARDERLAAGVLEGRFAWVEAGVLDPSEGTGPWIAHPEPGPSRVASVARRVR